MAFDYKKEYRALYLPGREPRVIEVPRMSFVAVEGEGDPNVPNGAYQQAMAVLYSVAYTLKMSKLGSRKIDGYFDYVVPPLEGFWRQDGAVEIDYSRKADFRWISAIRLPDFVGPEDFEWAVGEAERKKKLDCSSARYVTFEEGLCAQAMHVGPYDDELATLARLRGFIEEQGLILDITDRRLHHEIYLGDPRRVAPEKLKTVLRLPVRRKE